MQPLGQHFLINKKAIDIAIAELNLQKNDFVIEIGPGKGVLTLPLAKKLQDLSGKLVAIEKDPALVDTVRSRARAYSASPEDRGAATSNGVDKLLKTLDRQPLPIQVISGDALKILPQLTNKLETRSYKLVGNIPYYITGHLLRIIGELNKKPRITVLMVQKEVAERITAKPPHMNLLAAATQIWADISMILRLKPKDFDPPPKVESAVIKLETKKQRTGEGELIGYYKFIKAAFKQPRKTLLNNLWENQGENQELKKQKTKEKILTILKEGGYNEKTRSQELKIEELLTLSREFSTAY
jgi:16S rRNA (adenine1518-N6/adenine1519-N6)-dimethyltransferase